MRTQSRLVLLSALGAVLFGAIGCGGGGSTTGNTSTLANFTVGPSGGTFSLGRATVTIPAGSLASTGRLTLSLQSLPPTDPRVIGATRVNVTLTGATLSTPATLALDYLQSEVGSLRENSLRIGRFQNNRWEPTMTSVLNETTNRVTLQLNSFSSYTVFGRTTPSDTPRVLFRHTDGRLMSALADGSNPVTLYTPNTTGVDPTSTVSVSAATFNASGSTVTFARRIDTTSGSFSETWRVNEDGTSLSRIRVNVDTATSMDVNDDGTIIAWTADDPGMVAGTVITTFSTATSSAYSHGSGTDGAVGVLTLDDRVMRQFANDVGGGSISTTYSLANFDASNVQNISTGALQTLIQQIVPDQFHSQSRLWFIAGDANTGPNATFRKSDGSLTETVGLSGTALSGCVRWDDTEAYFITGTNGDVLSRYNVDSDTVTNISTNVSGAVRFFDVR